MGGSCCENNCAVEALRAHQKSTLVKVLWINALMFLVIAAAALYGQSTALLSDSLDNLGDALTYGLSLYVVSQSIRAKARVALFKGGLIFMGASVVIGQVIWKLIDPVVPSYEVMSVFSLAGLAANGLCLWLLWRHRAEDINMSSVFECSRNDIASNLSVFLAAGGVWFFGSSWPDIIVASLLAALLLRSSVRVIRGAFKEIREHSDTLFQRTILSGRR
jgi:Co/Zn/Cd efflux system component